MANLKLFEVEGKEINSLKDTSTHQLYFDNEEDIIKFNAEDYFESNKEYLKKKTNRIKNNQLHKLNNINIDENEEKKLLTNRKLLHKRLKEKLKNVSDLDNISKALANQKELIVKENYIYFFLLFRYINYLETWQKKKN